MRLSVEQRVCSTVSKAAKFAYARKLKSTKKSFVLFFELGNIQIAV